MPKAILLLSGGLDSTLAGRLLIDLGVEVEALNFTSPFCRCTPRSLGCSAARKAAEQLGIPVRVVACGEDYLEVVKHPKFGRGSEMNACVDCRIFMFSRAREYMVESKADFVATGEVLGERPMSQRRAAMAVIERESGLEGLIVRPLCAKVLEPSRPERSGVVDRDRLLGIRGRSRKPQLELVKALGITDFLCPAGGCLLTDPEFAARFADLLRHEPDFGLADAHLLRVGRHFRLPRGTKAVVGRDEAENGDLERLAREGDVLLAPVGVPGPTVLCRGPLAETDAALAAGLVSTYTKGGVILDVEVSEARRGNATRALRDVRPLDRAMVAKWRVGGVRSHAVLAGELKS